MAATHIERRSAAAEQLRQRRGDLQTEATVRSLCDGLDMLADLLYSRIDRDVEQRFGMDSMLMPTSTMGEVEAATKARTLIDVYSCVVAAEEAAERQYIDDSGWFVDWMIALRVAEHEHPSIAQRAAKYRDMPRDKRRLSFAASLERRVPLATKAPLIIYRLYPLGIRLAVAVAFGDHLRAGALRNQQMALLPVIADCHQCHGRPLDNGDHCQTCSNPLWGYEWLTAAD